MGDTLKERIRSNLNDARRERDKLRTVVLTTILSDIRNREIELGREAGDPDVTEIVNRGIKRRREAAEQMRAGQRLDLAEKEEQEVSLLSVYLPPPLGEAEVRRLIREAIAAGAQNVGMVMGKLAPQIKGRFDGKEANRLVQEELKP
jgi:uncharacterized protein YqeY